MSRSESPIDRLKTALDDMPAWMATRPAGEMGQVAIDCQQIINRTQAVSVEATRWFEASGGYKADGALGIVPWLKDKAKLSGADAADHVQVARQLKHLSRTEEALARWRHQLPACGRARDHCREAGTSRGPQGGNDLARGRPDDGRGRLRHRSQELPAPG